jgi:hypothetical protein
MKKILTLCALSFAFVTSSLGQAYEQGRGQLNLGIGLGSTIGTVPAGVTASSVPPISASYEYGLKDKISVGGYVGYTSLSYSQNFFNDTWSWNFSYLILGARGSYHFLTSDKLDPYAGLMLGYNIASVDYKINNVVTTFNGTAGGFTFSGHLGARYLFTDKIGAFAEIGYGISYLNLGLHLKM